MTVGEPSRAAKSVARVARAWATISAHEIHIRSQDGADFQATCFRDVANPPRALLVFTPAMGARASYYHGLAQELAGRGLCVFVADLRGIGSSSVRAGRDVDFGYHELISLDLPAVIASARRFCPTTPLVLVGHSIGGHISAMYAGIHPGEIQALVLIATGTSFFENWSVPKRMGILAMATLTRLITAAFGYFPGRYFGFFGREARRLMHEWRTLTMTGRFEVTGSVHDFEERLLRVKLPVLAISFPGDVFAPEEAVKHFMGKMPLTEVAYRHIQPRELGARSLNHFRWAKYPAPVANVISQWLLETPGPLLRNEHLS